MAMLTCCLYQKLAALTWKSQHAPEELGCKSVIIKDVSCEKADLEEWGVVGFLYSWLEVVVLLFG